MLTVTNLHKTFRTGFRRRGKKQVLKGLSLQLQQGEIYGLLGTNGAGKTTLLQCIMGFIPYDEGNILYNKKPFDSHALASIGYAPDATQYYDHLTAREHLRQVGSLLGLQPQAAEQQGQELLARVGLAFAIDAYVRSYSAGMKKRLGIVLSLLGDPAVLLWDEPMSGLDPLGRIVIKDLMLDLHKQGKTILFSTHILPDVREVCSRCGILHNGHICYEKKIADIDGDLETVFKEQVGQL